MINNASGTYVWGVFTYGYLEALFTTRDKARAYIGRTHPLKYAQDGPRIYKVFVE
jgi:hypothetical protein